MIASEPVRIPATDGVPLAATVFRPPATTAPTDVVVVASAMGVRHPYYYPFAEYVAGRGAAVVTFDYRGIGRSRPARLRGFEARLRDWGALDLAGVIDWALRAFPDRPVRVVAHSVGGQILGLAVRDEAPSSVLAVAAQSGYWGGWTGMGRLRVLSLWYLLIPLLAPAFGYFPSRWVGLGENLPEGVAREWAHWGRHPRYVLGRVGGEDAARYAAYRGRLRAVGLRDDGFAPEATVRGLLEFYPNAAREMHLLHPREVGLDAIGHFGFFRESVGGRLWPAEVDWLLDQAGGGAGVGPEARSSS